MRVRFLSLLAALLSCLALSASAEEIVSDSEVAYTPGVGMARVFIRSNYVRLDMNDKLGFDLTGDTSLLAKPGSTVKFVHRLENTSAVTKHFEVLAVNQANDQFDLIDPVLAPDTQTAQQTKGIFSLKTDEITLAPGESTNITISGRVPDTIKKGDKSALVVTARDLDLGGIIARGDKIDSLVVEGSALFVEKLAARPEVEIGETLDYTIRVRNVTDYPFNNVQLTDELPLGFTYERGSLRFNRVTVTDPANNQARRLIISIPTIAAGETITVNYRVRVGVTALQGDGINRVTANVDSFISNTGTARVTIRQGVFTTKGVVIGRVFVDSNSNGHMDEGELSVPGVRLYLEDGTYAITDVDGKYSFYGLNPTTHVLKVDATSLPRGTKLTVISNQQAGDADTRFVPLKNAELHRANFALAPVSATAKSEIEARQQRLNANAGEASRELSGRLTADGAPLPIADPKSLASTGVIVSQPDDAPGLAGGVANSSKRYSFKIPDATVPAKSESTAKLNIDALLDKANNTLGFAGLVDGQSLPIAQSDILVKGPIGARFSLAVNGAVIGADRIGSKATVPSRELEAWTFVGVDLNPGENRLRVSMTDPFGNARGSETITVIAPGSLAEIKLTSESKKIIADGYTPAAITIELTDALGTLVTSRTPITLNASLGQWLVEDVDPAMPGVQCFIEGGKKTLELLPPLEPGNSLLSATSGLIHTESELIFTPNLRPMLAVGVIEGAIHFNSGNRASIVSAGSRDPFEAELRNLSSTSSNGRLGAGARTAFFLKGKIKGDALLTAAFDSDKATGERLFRDIQPGEFYPVYGDSSTRGYDAQSTSKLYVRIDKNRSYLLFGDFTTQSLTSGLDDPRTLGNYQRSLTGVKEHYENDRVRANVWASQDSTRQVIVEIPANGTSGPYTFAAQDGLANSERIEILTRDRNQSSRIIDTRPMSRFFDYEFEPFTGRLLFRAPIPSVDADLNPISIRVTYEVDQGGDKFLVYGGDAQVKVTEKLEVGGAYARDENPQDHNELGSVNASYLLAQRTKLSAELAQSRTDLDGTGYAGRVDFKHQDARNEINAYVGKTETSFHNPAASLMPGRVEGGFKSVTKLTEKTALLTQGLITEDVATGGQLKGARVDVERTIGTTRVAVGGRVSRETAASSAPSIRANGNNDVDSVHAKVSFVVPKVENANAYVEYEQDVHDSDKRLAAVGIDYSFLNRGRLYARHEFISSLGGPFELNSTETNRTTIVGFESSFMKGGRTFNEYRASNEVFGREAEAALGVRNLWDITEGVRGSTSFERIVPVSGIARNESTAVTGALEYARSPLWRANGRLELRTSQSTDSALNTLGYARQMNRDWTFLAKSIVLLTHGKGASSGNSVQGRLQTGAAWRPAFTDHWTALGKYEYKYESDDRATALVARRNAHIISTDVNYSPDSPWTLSAHYASKWVQELTNSLGTDYYAHLVSARYTYALTRRLELGLNVAVLTNGDFTQRQFAIGPEFSFMIRKNVSVGVGYNLIGFRERDLASDNSTDQGFYFRLRMKFDEKSLPIFSDNSNESSQ